MECPTLAVLGSARLCTDCAQGQVPYFAESPAGDCSERHEGPESLGKAPPDRFYLSGLEEPLPRVVLAEHRDIRSMQDFLSVAAEGQGSLQRCESMSASPRERLLEVINRDRHPL